MLPQQTLTFGVKANECSTTITTNLCANSTAASHSRIDHIRRNWRQDTNNQTKSVSSRTYTFQWYRSTAKAMDRRIQKVRTVKSLGKRPHDCIFLDVSEGNSWWLLVDHGPATSRCKHSMASCSWTIHQALSRWSRPNVNSKTNRINFSKRKSIATFSPEIVRLFTLAEPTKPEVEIVEKVRYILLASYQETWSMYQINDFGQLNELCLRVESGLAAARTASSRNQKTTNQDNKNT